ncbi:MAG: HigA family addiction module antidote protein [Desulfuromonadales bacterium]|nr:HigA family addiction module antidote protein [Desulfuromonadales bacterium]
MTNNMRPIHPGEILREEMEELNLSARQLAAALSVPPNRVTGILNEQRAVTADTALRLARYFGTAPEFWMNLQAAYELRRTRFAHGEKISREVQQRPVDL